MKKKKHVLSLQKQYSVRNYNLVIRPKAVINIVLLITQLNCEFYVHIYCIIVYFPFTAQIYHYISPSFKIFESKIVKS